MPTQLAIKTNAHEILEKELHRRAKRKEYGLIAISTSTEAWMDIEKKYRITRKCLSAISYYKFPVHCITKSPLILRDIDILYKIHKDANLPPDLTYLNTGAIITISMSTIDKHIFRIFKPQAPPPDERLDTLQQLRNEKFICGIAYIPVLPYISDTQEQLESMIKTAKYYDALYIFIGTLTLYGNGKELYLKILEKRFPDLILKYKELYKHRSQPPKRYQLRLEHKAMELCNKHRIRFMIRHIN